MRFCRLLCLLALHVWFVGSGPAGSAQPLPVGESGLVAGPMLGHVTHRTAAVWVQTTPGSAVQVRATPLDGDSAFTPAERPARSPEVTAASDGTATVVLAGLEPGWTYDLAVTVDGEPITRPYPTTLTTQPLWQWRHDPPTVTAAIGSCFYVNDPTYDRPGGAYGGDPAILQHIGALDPDLMLWLGDNVYLREVDWWSAAGIAYRYSHTRAVAELQPLLASAAHYATWDDHDYGPNNADRSYVLKREALDTFRRFWPNPTTGVGDVPGVFTTFQWADVQFFLLDDRYHRTPNEAPPDAPRTILGEKQLTWLLDALTFSDAPFKVIALGGQLLNPVERFETYANVAPEERRLLLDEIRRRGIEGVVFVSGDRHHTELMRLDEGGFYPLYEFTSSPLTSGAVDTVRENNPLRIEGTLVEGQRSFGTITVSGPRGDRVMTLRAYGSDGTQLWETAIPQSLLRIPDVDFEMPEVR